MPIELTRKPATRTENHGVGGSIPPLGTMKPLSHSHLLKRPKNRRPINPLWDDNGTIEKSRAGLVAPSLVR